MSKKPIINAQDIYIYYLKEEKTLVTIFTTVGRTITGVVKAYDKYCLVLETHKGQVLVYKSHINSIEPEEEGIYPLKSEQ